MRFHWWVAALLDSVCQHLLAFISCHYIASVKRPTTSQILRRSWRRTVIVPRKNQMTSRLLRYNDRCSASRPERDKSSSMTPSRMIGLAVRGRVAIAIIIRTWMCSNVRTVMRVLSENSDMWIKKPCRLCGGPTEVIDPAWLRGRRQLTTLSVRALARQLGHSAAYLSDIERGARRCTEKMLKAYKTL